MPPMRKPGAIEEDAADLQFPHAHWKTQNEKAEEEQELSKVFLKTFTYASPTPDHFGKCQFGLNLEKKRLHKFEIAVIANLCPETAEETKTLISSLECPFEDKDFQGVLDLIHCGVGNKNFYFKYPKVKHLLIEFIIFCEVP